MAPRISTLWDSVGNTPLLRIGTFLCDHGSRDASKVFNPEFLARKSLLVRPLP